MKESIFDLMEEKELDAVLVSDGYNMRYHSGFCGATGYLYLSRSRKVLTTDSRYTTQAREEAPDYEVAEIGGSLGYGDVIAKLMREDGVKRIGFEDTQFIYADFVSLRNKCPGAEWAGLGESLNRLRCIKTPEELEKIAKAEEIGDLAFKRILEDVRPGVSELFLAARLDYYMRELGAESNSFDTIMASGLHSAMPHAIPSAKKLELGDFVTMDFGCHYKGYCSDMTRTIVLGHANEKQKEVYRIVLEAQTAAIEALCAGKTGREVDAVARGIIGKAGYGDYFGHGLGHSVGLFIHEAPSLSPKCEEVLRENITMTVEPGIYVPGFGGVRIEDLVVITETGCKNLTHSPKELIEL